MGAVRYVALLALVVWVGGLVAVQAGEIFRRADLLGYVCGGILLVCLLVMKFIGPPPRAFRLRFGIVVAMLAVTLLAGLRADGAHAVSRAVITVDVALGAWLLSWYVRE